MKAIGWLILPKVFGYISIVIFPITYAPKVSPSEKISKFFEIYYPYKPIIVSLYRGTL